MNANPTYLVIDDWILAGNRALKDVKYKQRGLEMSAKSAGVMGNALKPPWLSKDGCR